MTKSEVENAAQLAAVDLAVMHLRAARDLLRRVGAKRTLTKVRKALKSADGARRHVSLAPYREARQRGSVQ